MPLPPVPSLGQSSADSNAMPSNHGSASAIVSVTTSMSEYPEHRCARIGKQELGGDGLTAVPAQIFCRCVVLHAPTLVDDEIVACVHRAWRRRRVVPRPEIDV